MLPTYKKLIALQFEQMHLDLVFVILENFYQMVQIHKLTNLDRLYA